MAARAQLNGALHERDERSFPRVVDRRQAGAGLDADREDWVRYLRERARHPNGETDAAEVDRGFIPAHTTRRATGEKEARRVTWLDQVTTSLAKETGVDASVLELSPDTVRALLDVARAASHSSGERIYAPLLCYVLGMLSAHGVPLEKAIAVVQENASGE